MSRINALKLNTAASLLSELIVLISGLILPRLVLLHFGSSCNGLVNSISQFLGLSAVLRAGMGGAIRAALYKPLAENDDATLNGIMVATRRHMRKIGAILGIGILAFAAIYPVLVGDEYDWFFAFTMVLLIGISTFTDNFFGITCKILLQADQKYYIQIGINALATLASSIISVVLILSGYTIQIVKLGAAVGGILNPLLLNLYVKKHYQIDWEEAPNDKVIRSRWDAFFHQVATIINSNIDLTLLTVFVSLREVSVYTVHFMVVNNIGKVVNSFALGINSTFGDMIARKENTNLKKSFFMIEWALMAISVVCYSVTLVMLPSFLKLYTESVNDVNYIRPVFAGLMVVTTMLQTSRLPYQLLAEGAGRFKETRNGAIFEVVSNLIMSVFLAKLIGLEGVLVATLIAGIIRTIEFSVFCFKNILHISLWHIVKHYSVLSAAFAICYMFGKRFVMAEILNYPIWMVNAAIATLISVCIVGGISLIFYRDQLKDMLKRFHK